jgi:hypothetical protein
MGAATIRWSRRHIVAALVAAGLIAASIVGRLVLHGTGGPAEHDNPSFRYGEKVMHNYGAFNYAPDTATTKKTCEAAVRRAPNRPPHLDETEAVRGCLYEEYYLDN